MNQSALNLYELSKPVASPQLCNIITTSNDDDTNLFTPKMLHLISNSRNVELYSGSKYVTTLKGDPTNQSDSDKFAVSYNFPPTQTLSASISMKCLSLRPKNAKTLAVSSYEISTSGLGATVDAALSNNDALQRRVSQLEGEVSLLKMQMASVMSIMPSWPLPLLPPTTHNIFVYGTLKTNFYNFNRYLNNSTATFVDTCHTTTRHRLLILDYGVPCLLGNDDDNKNDIDAKIIDGELFSVDDSKLAELDELEGLNITPTTNSGDWCRYERRPITVVRSNGEHVACQYYCYVGSAEGDEVFERAIERGYFSSYSLEYHEREYTTKSERTIKNPKKEVNEGPVTLDKLGLLKELQTMDVNEIFSEPVDAVAFNLKDYHSIVKMPMDFRTIRQRVTYTEMEHDEFAKLVNLTFDNALLYNGKNKTSLVCVEASRLKKHFNDKYEKKKEGV
ncbi:hypothetical protein ScalyP_jg6811 [Parmales sp. scaly parma]|nr:hypothetical protein ScalyP_jg6811 [Parmales sp. scaly parma]